MLMLQTVNQDQFILYRILHKAGRKDLKILLHVKPFVIKLDSPFKNRCNKTEKITKV
jgi:hypothetical protein